MPARKYFVDLDPVRVLVRSGHSVKSAANVLGIPRDAIVTEMQRQHLKAADFKFDQHFFEVIDSEVKAYWLGFLMADGCVTSNRGREEFQKRLQVKVAVKDGEHLTALNVALSSNIKISHILHPGGYTDTPAVQLVFASLPLCQDLIRHGCVPRKSLILGFPEVPSDLVRHLVRGYFDGNGSAEIRRQGVSIPTLRLSFVGAHGFLSGIAQWVLKQVGVTMSFRPSKKIWCLSACGNIKAPKIRDWMYDGATVWLNRKMAVCYSN